MRECVCARPRERVHDGLTRVWQARCRCYLSVMSAHLPSRRERAFHLSFSSPFFRLLPASTRVSSPPSSSFSYSLACELFARVALLWPCSVDTSSVEIANRKISKKWSPNRVQKIFLDDSKFWRFFWPQVALLENEYFDIWMENC